MRKYNIPVTRKNYLELNYPNGVPHELTVENELDMPKELQRPVKPKPQK